MGPKLLCSLACCAGLLLVPPVGAKDMLQPMSTPVAQKMAVAPAPDLSLFKRKVAAIIADSASIPGAWSDTAHDRLATQFRLKGDHEADKASVPLFTSLIGRVKRREDTRGMTFGFDGGSANLGPPVDAAARSAEVVAYKLSEASACNGLMPGVNCGTIGGDDVSVRLALALNF